MCGIAGFSLTGTSSLDPWRAARVLLASVAERGADAAGCAYVSDEGLTVHKQPGGASAFLEKFNVPANLQQVLLHVRDHTKGRPSLAANNHPIRHGSIVGVHNGRISNDDDIFRELACGRAEPGMTVDSEAIFAMLHRSPCRVRALEQLRGSLAIGWFDESAPDSVWLARGYGRPLWLASTEEGDLLWASTLEALEIVEDFLRVSLHKRPLAPGTIHELSNGEVLQTLRFEPDRTATWLLNPATSPDERTACLAKVRVQAAS